MSTFDSTSTSDGSPDRPWKARSEWRDGRITSTRESLETGSERMILILGAQLFILGLIAVVMGVAFSSTSAVVGGGLALGGGGGLVGWKMYNPFLHRDFGTTTFEMETMPGVIGGPLCGTLHTPIPVEDAPDTGFRVSVSCYRRYHISDSSSPKYTLLWRDEKRLEGQPAEDGTLKLPVGFELPQDPPPSTPEKTDERIMWTVEVAAEVSGSAYEALLEVPVFPVASEPSVDPEAYTDNELVYAPDEPVTDKITLRRPARDELEITVDNRRFGKAALLAVSALVLVGGGGAAFARAYTLMVGPGGTTGTVNIVSGIMLLFVVIWVAIGSFVLYAGAMLGRKAYKVLTARQRVVVDGRGIQVEKAHGEEIDTPISCSALDEARLEVGGGGPSEADYDLHLHYTTTHPLDEGNQEHEVVAIESLPNHLEAEWLAGQIETVAARQAQAG